MPGLDARGLDELDQALNQLLEECPEMPRELHEEIARALKEEVDASIAATLNGDVGKIQDWQQERVGDRGGYAAISAIGSSQGASTGPNSPGAITNYLDGGHKVRQPETPGKAGNAKLAYVDGRHFYQRAATQVEAKAIRAAASYAERFAGKLEGDR